MNRTKVKRDKTMQRKKGAPDPEMIKALARALQGREDEGEQVRGLDPSQLSYRYEALPDTPQDARTVGGVPGFPPVQGYRWNWDTPPSGKGWR